MKTRFNIKIQNVLFLLVMYFCLLNLNIYTMNTLSMPVDRNKIIEELKQSVNNNIKNSFSSKSTHWQIITKYKNSLKIKNGWEKVLDASHISIHLLLIMMQDVQSKLPIFMKELDEDHFYSLEGTHESLSNFFREAFCTWNIKYSIDELTINNDIFISYGGVQVIYKKIEMSIQAEIYDNTFLRGFDQNISITYGILKSCKPKEHEITLPSAQTTDIEANLKQREVEEELVAQKEELKKAKSDLITATAKEQKTKTIAQRLFYGCVVSGLGFIIMTYLYLKK